MLPKKQSLGSSEHSAFHSPTGRCGVSSRLALAWAGCKEMVNKKGQIRGLEEHDKQLLRGNSPGGRNEEGRKMKANHNVQKSYCEETSTDSSLLSVLNLAVC